ncbi:hypothetical protein [Brevundimonas sp. FT23028]|uniref:hypothetical protein n=1 Tax=Brevundimonas sp. FT23028 TaxID=3393748 RepID=UPI003B586FAF
MKATKTAVVLLAFGLAVAQPLAAGAGTQDLRALGRGAIPNPFGNGPSRATAHDPDVFLREGVEATKQMMVAAAVLAQMARNKDDMAGIRMRVNAIQNIESADELGAYNAAFEDDIDALKTNASDAADLQAIYDSANRNQRSLMLDAGVNMIRAGLIDAQLMGDFSNMLSSAARNPANISKVGHLRTLGGLAGSQLNAVGSMIGPVTALLRSQNVAVPDDANLGRARTISL